MPIPALANLQKIGQLKAEKPNPTEIERLLTLAKQRLKDSAQKNISAEGRFTIVYNALHCCALAALRWHGYRSENRYLVFQSLQHTLSWPAHQWRIIDQAHRQRNLAEYEGFFDIEESFIKVLHRLATQMLADVIVLTHGATP